MNFQERIKSFYAAVSKPVKAAFWSALALIVYGWIVKAIPVYFFWESSAIGGMILSVLIASFLITEFIIYIKFMNKKYRHAGRHVFVVVSVLMVAVLHIIFLSSDALQAVKDELRKNPIVIDRVGEVKGFGFFLTGGIESSSNDSKTITQGSYSLIVKGSKAFMDVDVAFYKENEEPWQIEIMTSDD